MHLRPHLAALALLAGLLTASSLEVRAQSSPPPRLVPAGQAVLLLQNEAAEVFRADKAQLSIEEKLESDRPEKRGPESACDFAQRRNLAAQNEDVVRVVLRRLHQENAGMDAYIRWQMLSFKPRFDGLVDPKDVRRILAAMPQFTAQPQYTPPPPPGQQAPASSLTIATQRTVVVGQSHVPNTGGSRPRLAVVTSGVTLGNGGGDASAAAGPPPDPESIMADLRERRKKMADTNKWVAQFRDALIPMLPESDGVRLTVLLQDTHDRLAAGDPTWESAVAQLMAACEALPRAAQIGNATQPRGTLSLDARKALAAQAKQLGALSTPVIDGMQQKGNGELALEGYYVRFPPDQLKRMLALLAGEPVPVMIPPRAEKPATDATE